MVYAILWRWTTSDLSRHELIENRIEEPSMLSHFSDRYSCGWLLFGISCVVIIHVVFGMVSSSSAQSSEMTIFTGNTPESVIEQFLDEDRPEGVETEITQTSQAGDYAVSTYIYGETGGFVVLQKENGQWQNICADGGAFDGTYLVNFCKIPITNAQALWTQYLADSDEH